jgi:hypothetical protein
MKRGSLTSKHTKHGVLPLRAEFEFGGELMVYFTSFGSSRGCTSHFAPYFYFLQETTSPVETGMVTI